MNQELVERANKKRLAYASAGYMVSDVAVEDHRVWFTTVDQYGNQKTHIYTDSATTISREVPSVEVKQVLVDDSTSVQDEEPKKKPRKKRKTVNE